MSTWALPTSSVHKIDLTQRQNEVFEFIREFCKEHGYPPARTDICGNFGWKSPNAAQEVLVVLQTKHWIELTPGVSRGIKIL